MQKVTTAEKARLKTSYLIVFEMTTTTNILQLEKN